MEQLQSKLLEISNGFKIFEAEAKRITESHSSMDSKEIALNMLSNEFYQIRSCGVFILGFIAIADRSVLFILKNLAAKDPSWQVQEIIAKAFDQFCRDNHYEKSLPEIEEWLKDANPNVCRVVIEGLRVWTSRPYFKEHPEKAVELIRAHKASESEYLRTSVGNSLRDIGKKYSELIQKEISTWDLDDANTAFTYQYVLKRH